MNGIQARKDVIIQNEASFNATLKGTSNAAKGVFANNNIIIDTIGNIDINFSNSDNGYGIYATGKMEIKHVNSMLITLPLTGVASTTNFTTGTVDVSSGVAVNKSTTKASYRSGTPYTLGLEGGDIKLATGEVIGSPHQYLVDDEITIQSTISESNFDRWTKADGTELIGSLFIDSTTANSTTATIKMPAESFSIKAKEKDSKISITAIPGVTAPVTGATPVTTPIETAQYTGTVAWNGSPVNFDANTVYTATITITPKTGYTLTGVAANFFTVDGATATNTENTGEVTAIFPATALSSDATLTSSIGTVDNTANTIVDVPNATSLADFKAAITPAIGATFKVYQADGTTEATDLSSGYKVIVTAQDPTTTKTYIVTVSDFAAGSGTSVDPYLVSTAEELNNVRNYLNQENIHFKQTQDINLNVALWNEDEGWLPIGKFTTTEKFKGIYDGDGKTISGLTIKRPSEEYQGLFGCSRVATLKNIKLTDVNLKGKDNVGGLVGDFNNGTMENCSATGIIVGEKNTGGLVGNHSYGTITKSYSTCTVTGTRIVGGLAGSSNSGSIEKSYATGNVTGSGDNIGGLIGYNGNPVTNCYATGGVSGSSSIGGLIGKNTSGTITLSYYDKETTGQTDTGKGEGKTTADMKKQDTFVGWDFTDIWSMVEDTSYPTLK